MPYTLDQFFPSLSAMGMWTYWVFALCAMLETTVLIGVLVPGAIVIFAGGMLAQRGVIDIVDLAWFVAIGSFVGGEISFRLGRWARLGLGERPGLIGSRQSRAAAALLRKRGGLALVIGRYRGQLAAFVPFSAALATMRHGRFTTWNAGSALAYAVGLPIAGYLCGLALSILLAATPRILAFGAVVVLALGILFFIARRTRRALPSLKEIAIAISRGLSRKPAVRRFLEKHPRLTRHFVARFGTDQFLGLTATVLGVLLLYIVGAYADSVYDFLGTQGAASTDTRIANLLYTMRDDRLIAVLSWITEVGGRHGVLPLLAGATFALALLRRFDLLAGMWIAAAGNQITVTLLKGFFARPRSDLGYYVETSGSFPSGHAAGAIAVWAMLFYLAWRLRLLGAGVAGAAAVTIAFLIGISRVYLVEHYLSDVLNGYLVGALWLILGIAFCEWRRRVPRARVGNLRRGLAAGCVVIAGVVAIFVASTTVSPMNPALDRATRTVTRADELLAQVDFPEMTEVLSGAPRQPINLIITAPDAVAVTHALTQAGWTAAPRPGLVLLARAFADDWTGRAIPDPLVITTFWDNRPTAFGFAMAASQADDTRLHLRLWDSLTRTTDGQVVFVSTLTQEDPLAWTLNDDAMAAVGAKVPATLDAIVQTLRGAGLGTTLP